MPDLLPEKMSSYHPKIKFTVENSPAMFLDTRMIIDMKGVCATKVYWKPNKVPLHWFSKSPVRYKRNAIIGDLHRSNKISSYFRDEVELICCKYYNAGFPTRFLSLGISNHQNHMMMKTYHLSLHTFLKPSLYFD